MDNANTHSQRLIADLLDSINEAILSGDWYVDGANDPDSLLYTASIFLKDRGWTQNTIDNSWMKPNE